MRYLAAFCLLTVATALASAGDQDKFQGAWQRGSIVDDGKPVDDAEKGSVVFSAGGYMLKEGDTVKSTGTFKLDETREPKEFDVMPRPEYGQDAQRDLQVRGRQADLLHRWT
jgi:uncharacterized protein (TIGR03067 family)